MSMKPLTQVEYDAALVGHDSDGNESFILTADSDSVFVFGENGLVTLKVFGDAQLSESECRRLAAALVRLADIWCVS